MDEQQSPFPQPTAAEPPGQDGAVGPAKRRRGHRLLATVTATAVVAGVGGVGAGYALGHGFGSAGTSQTTTGSSGRSNVSQQGGTGTTQQGGTIPQGTAQNGSTSTT